MRSYFKAALLGAAIAVGGLLAGGASVTAQTGVAPPAEKVCGCLYGGVCYCIEWFQSYDCSHDGDCL